MPKILGIRFGKRASVRTKRKHMRARNSGTIAYQFSHGGPGLKPLTKGIGRSLRIIK